MGEQMMPETMREILHIDLDDKIEDARRCGERYTPSKEEWDRARPWQRDRMTWPDDVLRWIRRGT